MEDTRYVERRRFVMKWIRRIVGVLLLFVLVVVGALFLIPTERIARVATEQMRVVTGREVTINGDVNVTLWPVLGVSAGGLEVGNAEWAKDGTMLTAENAAIGVDAMALLQGEVRITKIEATSPTIRLEQKLDGRASWQFTDASGEAQIETETSPDRAPQAISIQSLKVTNATFVYDAEGSDLVSYSGVDLTLDWPERLGPAVIAATLRPAGTAVELDATIDAFAGFIAGQVQPIDVVVQAANGRVALKGRASTAGDVAVQLSMAVPDTDAFFRALALPAPGLPRGLGRAVDLKTELTLTADRRLSLRNVVADLGGNALTGAADISLNGTPQINAQLDAGALDLSSLSEGDASDAGGGSAETGWSKATIDASGLAGFNGEIALRAASIDLGQFKLGQTRTLLTNDRSRMVFELREVQAYEGVLTGQFVINNRSGLSVGGKMKADGIGVQPLLVDAAGIDRLTGAAAMELSFLGVGGSMHAIMNSLSGDGAIRLGSGTILGLDLDKLMKSGSGSGGTTIFDSLGATFTMKDGNLFNEDLLLALRSFEARGAGRVGLGAQDIDYLFTPIALKVNEGKGLAIPVRIKGPWSGPRILPDLEKALDLNLEAEKEKLKAQAEAELKKAEDKVKAKVAEELGVTSTDGKSLEDAAKTKVEDELKKGLRGLLGR